jgi:hypothetical protein
VIDLPGPDAVELALALGRRGFRPILAINATSAEREVIDMGPVLRSLAEGARFASSFPRGPDVLPAFILDARREGTGAWIGPGLFDNRWPVFPSDLPAAEHFEAARIRTVVIVHDGDELREDLRAIAWSWRRDHLDVRVAKAEDAESRPWTTKEPGWLARMAGRLRRRFALRRRADGSYGHRIPVPLPPEPSHG